MSKRIRDSDIITALLSCVTVRSAAVQLGISEQTIYRRMRELEFKQAYNEARRERTAATRNKLQASTHRAALTLEQIMLDINAPAQTRVNAAAEILRQAAKFTEISDILDRLEELEKHEN